MKTVNVKIFERGDLIERIDLIACHRNDHDAKQYGLVLEDQDPNDPNRVKVRDLKQCRDTVWTDINDIMSECGRCWFVKHLDDVLIDINDGNGIPIVL